MGLITAYWLPILVSAVVVFFASFVAWMILPHHAADVRTLPQESELTTVLERLNLPPGTYMWPNCEDKKEMSSDAFKARYEAGPWGNMTILADKPNFGRNLAMVFALYLVLSAFVAYITGQARPAGAGFLPVFQVAGATAVLGYCFGSIPNALFFGKPARFVLTDFIDALAYGLMTGAIFAWLWPAGA